MVTLNLMETLGNDVCMFVCKALLKLYSLQQSSRACLLAYWIEIGKTSKQKECTLNR